MESFKDNLKMKITALLRSHSIPLTRGQISNALSVPYDWVDRLIRNDLKDMVQEVPVSPSRVGYVIKS